jgi:hypothetical protein
MLNGKTWFWFDLSRTLSYLLSQLQGTVVLQLLTVVVYFLAYGSQIPGKQFHSFMTVTNSHSHHGQSSNAESLITE